MKTIIEGDLDLRRSTITELPEGLVVKGSLDLNFSNITKLPNGLRVGGHLLLSGSKIVELPSDLVIGGSLGIVNTKIAELPSDIVIGGSLYLGGTNISRLPEGLVIGGSLYVSNDISELPENLTIGDTLFLRGTKIERLPGNLTVCGCLDAVGTKITELPNDLVVNGNLYIESCIYKVKHTAPSLLQWRGGKYVQVDRIFSEVVSHRGNVYIVKQIGDAKVRYLVTDGAGKWANGDTLQDAKADLMYKIANRDTSAYAGLSLDSELSLEEAIEAYRVITGACSAGTKMFVTNSLPERMDRYTISDIIRLTEGQFGNEEFANFFNN